MPEGTPGQLSLTQTGRYIYNSNGQPFNPSEGGDYFPAEHWKIQPVGH